jgi:hypothetical protein
MRIILSIIIMMLPLVVLGYLAYSAIADYWPTEDEEEDFRW